MVSIVYLFFWNLVNLWNYILKHLKEIKNLILFHFCELINLKWTLIYIMFSRETIIYFHLLPFLFLFAVLVVSCFMCAVSRAISDKNTPLSHTKKKCFPIPSQMKKPKEFLLTFPKIEYTAVYVVTNSFLQIHVYME